jgi:peptide/nickel transport system ATP-binding protein
MMEHDLYDKKSAIRRAGELLERFGLPERLFRAYSHQLSGGEQQRVLLAMAYANDPDLVIMDEPLSSLDVTTRNELASIIASDKDRAKLVITRPGYAEDWPEHGVLKRWSQPGIRPDRTSAGDRATLTPAH